MNIDRYFELLGYHVVDKVTGFDGIADSVTFDLYGCIQILVRPKGVNDKGETKSCGWFDVNRLKRYDDSDRVMPVPDFGQSKAERITRMETGPADKPLR